MAIGSRHILGIAIDDRCLLIAEVAVGGRRHTLRRAAEFAFPDGTSLQEPAVLGRALKAFLREQHFAARRAVLGLGTPCRPALTQLSYRGVAGKFRWNGIKIQTGSASSDLSAGWISAHRRGK